MKKKQNQASKLGIVQEEQMTPLMHHLNTIRVGYVDQKEDFKITWPNATKNPTLACIFIPQSLIGLEPSFNSRICRQCTLRDQVRSFEEL